MTQELIDIIEQARLGSQKAYSTLHNMFYHVIWVCLMSVVHNTEVANDLTSIVFTKAFAKLNLYTKHISFEMWLKTIAINTGIDYIRRTKNEKLNNYIDDEANNVQVTTEERSPDEDLILKEKLDLTMELLPTLCKKDRNLINARIEGLSYKDIALKYGMSEMAVKSDLNKARRRLKRKLLTNY